MPSLYRLNSGKIARKNIDGLMVIHPAPYDFVPTAGELKSNKFRMKLVTTVADDSKEVLEMLANSPKPAVSPERQVQKTVIEIVEKAATARDAQESQRQDDQQVKLPTKLNVCSLDVVKAVDLISTVQTNDELDELLIQESDNKPRVRKRVIAAIEGRRDEIAEIAREIHAAETMATTGGATSE